MYLVNGIAVIGWQLDSMNIYEQQGSPSINMVREFKKLYTVTYILPFVKMSQAVNLKWK